MELSPIIPYTSVFIDAAFPDLRRTLGRCFASYDDATRRRFHDELCRLFTTASNPNPVLPLYTVRTGFHLFLETQNFPRDSEVVMSAVNIPDMVTVVHYHGLRVVPIDVDIETTGVDPRCLEAAITSRTVAVVVAHVYGKWMDVEPLLTVAKRHNLFFIEDCAEAFCGYDWLGHPDSDLVLFSFGVIKVQTCFLGAIAKVRDQQLYDQLAERYATYVVQAVSEYVQKLSKYSVIYCLLNVPCVIKPGMELTRFLNANHQKYAVHMLRSFPKDPQQHLSKQPCTPLLATMVHRLKQFDRDEYMQGQAVARYAVEKLESVVTCVGLKARICNYWLFPVLVADPKKTIEVLRRLGVDGYSGSTQLDVIHPEADDPTAAFPTQAQYLIDHVVYLPIHKQVPKSAVDRICRALETAVHVHDFIKARL